MPSLPSASRNASNATTLSPIDPGLCLWRTASRELDSELGKGSQVELVGGLDLE